MAEDSDLLVRVTTLEVQEGYTKRSLDEQKGMLHEVASKVDDIQKHLARQNGTIPHMAESINLLTKDFRSFKDTYSDNIIASHQITAQTSIDNKVLEEVADSKVKIRIIWGVALAICTLVGHLLLKVLFHV